MNPRECKLKFEITYFKEAVENKKQICLITIFHREGFTYIGGEYLCRVQGIFYLGLYRKVHAIVPLNEIFYKLINNCQINRFKIGSVHHADQFVCTVGISDNHMPVESLLRVCDGNSEE